MKLQKIALAGVAALAMSLPAAASAGTGWYLGLGVGWDHLEKVKASSITFPGNSLDVSSKNDLIYAGTFGYKFDMGLRLEGEFSYTSHDIRRYTERTPIAGPVVPATGNERISAAMLNLLYDVDFGDTFGIYFGAGAGAGNLKINSFGAPGDIHGSHSGFMWQGIVGADVSLNEQVDLFVDFRYRGLDVASAYPSVGPFLGALTKIHSAQDQAIMGGFRWYVGHAAPPPPPPPAPPPPPPPPPPPVKTFIVFFDFDKSNLTAEAQSVVTEAVAAAKANGWVKVMVTGHTDTVGSDSYNQALSERRAGSVKDEMVRQGMDPAGITTQGKSFHDPLVPTGPGVREPQNRRAVIEY